MKRFSRARRWASRNPCSSCRRSRARGSKGAPGGPLRDRFGQSDEGMVLADGERFRAGRDGLHPRPGIFAGEGQDRFDFGVAREIFGAVGIDGGACGIERVTALLFAGSVSGMLCASRRKKAVASMRTRSPLRLPRETPDHGLGEGFFDGAAFLRVVGDGAVVLVGLDQQVLGPRRSKRTTIEPPIWPRSRPISLDPTPAGSEWT